MNHYEVLGVSHSASKSEIRRAYVNLARRYHPDFNQRVAETVDSASPESSLATKIRQVNAAWEILGDDDRRADYDLFLLDTGGRSVRDDGSASFRVSADGAPSASRIHRPSSEFKPKSNASDPDEVWRYSSDPVNQATVPSKLLLAAPAACFVLGIAMLIISVPTAIRAMTAFGIVCLFASGILFVGVPVLAMFKSQNEEKRVSHRR